MRVPGHKNNTIRTHNSHSSTSASSSFSSSSSSSKHQHHRHHQHKHRHRHHLNNHHHDHHRSHPTSSSTSSSSSSHRHHHHHHQHPHHHHHRYHEHEAVNQPLPIRCRPFVILVAVNQPLTNDGLVGVAVLLPPCAISISRSFAFLSLPFARQVWRDTPARPLAYSD